ncbi:MAG: D-amino-acid transaminase [Pseudomonadota bacterium]
MSRIAYVNGQYVPHRKASVHIEDRGYQFSDGIYEVCEVLDGRLIDVPGHLDRLERSARELDLGLPLGRAVLEMVMAEVCRRNRIKDGILYLQVTRGVAPRDHPFPKNGTRPALVMTAKSIPRLRESEKAERGVGVITLPDNRWERVDIKTVSLLPNVLAKQKARESGAYEAWFVDDEGFVTEGSSTNAWIVTQEGVIVTRQATRGILRGITRDTAIRAAQDLQYKIEERRFTVEEALQAREAFITAASTLVMPVVTIDGNPIGDAQPGEISRRLRAHYHDYAA